MANYDLAYPKTARYEGGYANVAGDRGGETYAGITRKNFPKWAGWPLVDKAKPLKNNAKVPGLEKMVKAFYKKEFWDVVAGDSIEDQATAERLYDFGVNAGYGRSIKQIQEVLGMAQTGKITNDLIEAINNPAKYFV